MSGSDLTRFERVRCKVKRLFVNRNDIYDDVFVLVVKLSPVFYANQRLAIIII